MRIFLFLILFVCFVFAHPLNQTKMVLDLNKSNFHMRFVSFNLQKYLNIENPSKDDILKNRKKIVSYIKRHIKIGNCILKDKKFTIKNEIVVDVDFDLQCLKSDFSPIKFNLFFDFDKTQQGIMKIVSPSFEKVLVFSVRKDNYILKLNSSENYFKKFVVEGIWHIWEGFDHLLFLLMLILPITLIGKSLKESLFEIFKIITAFTVSHSITLSLSAFNIFSPPQRLIESLIALSVLVSGINNLYPFVRFKKEWLLAFLFGFVHGFGFSEALKDLDLMFGNFVKAVFGFNLGVEIGQMAVVTAVFPTLFFLNHFKFYGKIYNFLVYSTVFISFFWFLQRAFGF